MKEFEFDEEFEEFLSTAEEFDKVADKTEGLTLNEAKRAHYWTGCSFKRKGWSHWLTYNKFGILCWTLEGREEGIDFEEASKANDWETRREE